MTPVDRRAALLLPCPWCAADPGAACWDEDGEDEVDIHEERVAAADGSEESYTFDTYDEKGRWRG